MVWLSRRKRGLTLGKFAPFHKGHQHLIETALCEMDEVLAIIYDAPETTSIPLTVRAGWIRELYPEVQVIEAWDGPAEAGDTPEIEQHHKDYILNTLKIQGITHFYSSEFYGEPLSRALGTENRPVDPDRQAVPISGTAIREDPYAWREYLHPRVYRDLIIQVVFLGAPTTGKTALTEQLAREYGTLWMPEYGQEYAEKHQVSHRQLSLGQLVEIAEGQLEREETLLCQANRYLFTDTNALTTCIHSLYYHGTVAPQLSRLADRCAARYDLVFLCDTDLPLPKTGEGSEYADREILQKQILSDLLIRKQPFFILKGGLETRIRTVKGVLERYRKYQNLGDFMARPTEVQIP